MEIFAISVFIALMLLELWVRRQAFRHLRYTGESRVRADTLAYLASEHYLPEGARWLAGLRLVTAACIVSFLAAFWSAVA